MARRNYETYMQDAIYEFIEDYKRANDGNSPTYEEIGIGVKCNRSNAYRYVQIMASKKRLDILSSGRINLRGEYIPPESS